VSKKDNKDFGDPLRLGEELVKVQHSTIYAVSLSNMKKSFLKLYIYRVEIYI